jgi:hypothetical protein
MLNLAVQIVIQSFKRLIHILLIFATDGPEGAGAGLPGEAL